jgi:hypothetical protein
MGDGFIPSHWNLIVLGCKNHSDADVSRMRFIQWLCHVVDANREIVNQGCLWREFHVKKGIR